MAVSLQQLSFSPDLCQNKFKRPRHEQGKFLRSGLRILWLHSNDGLEIQTLNLDFESPYISFSLHLDDSG